MNPAPISEPFTGAELRRDFDAVRQWGADFWSAFDAGRFFTAPDGAWSPADHVRHLIKANRPVAQALKVPRLLLVVRFGVTRRPSRSYSALRATYQEALGAGLQAGRFAPRPLSPAEQTDEQQRQILGRWSETLSDLTARLADCSELALGHLRLPHPGLGMLTLREMLFFTLYHNTHHVLGVARRT